MEHSVAKEAILTKFSTNDRILVVKSIKNKKVVLATPERNKMERSYWCHFAADSTGYRQLTEAGLTRPKGR